MWTRDLTQWTDGELRWTADDAKQAAEAMDAIGDETRAVAYLDEMNECLSELNRRKKEG